MKRILKKVNNYSKAIIVPEGIKSCINMNEQLRLERKQLQAISKELETLRRNANNPISA